MISPGRKSSTVETIILERVFIECSPEYGNECDFWVVENWVVHFLGSKGADTLLALGLEIWATWNGCLHVLIPRMVKGEVARVTSTIGNEGFICRNDNGFRWVRILKDNARVSADRVTHFFCEVRKILGSENQEPSSRLWF